MQINDDKNEKKLEVFENYTELFFDVNGNYYENAEYMRNVEYINIDGSRFCEREILFASFKYYKTHRKELIIAIITVLLVIS